MFIVYILFSPSLDKFYIGSTGDNMAVRLKKHASNHSGFTSRAKDWIIVYQEHFTEKTVAIKREKTLKSWKSSQRIQALINGSSIE